MSLEVVDARIRLLISGDVGLDASEWLYVIHGIILPVFRIKKNRNISFLRMRSR